MRKVLRNMAPLPVVIVLVFRISMCHALQPSPAIAPIVNSADAGATASPTSNPGSAADKSSVVNYYFEHMISEKEAASAFKTMVDELINRESPAWCPACTKTVVRYCLDNKMLQDHCCCDSGHARDTLPWLPHSCYVGDKCEPNIGSCVMYSDIRECCCDRIMAKQWRAKNSAQVVGHRTSWIVCIAAVSLSRAYLVF